MSALVVRDTFCCCQWDVQGRDRATYAELGAREQVLVHAHGVHERIGPQVRELVLLGELQHGQRVVRAVAEVGVALDVDVGQEVVLVLLGVGPVLGHAVVQVDEGVAQAGAHQRPLEHPGEEVARGEVVAQRGVAVQVGGRGHVQLVAAAHVRVGEVAAVLGLAVAGQRGGRGKLGRAEGERDQRRAVARLEVLAADA